LNHHQSGPFAAVLGVTQDGGHPHPGCLKTCCATAWEDPSLGHLIACLGIVDPATEGRWIIDASPDIGQQLHDLHALQQSTDAAPIDGIFITHAHIGHYTGLSRLGREGLGATAVPLFLMPRMEAFIRSNGPWAQLVENGNVDIRRLRDREALQLSANLTIEPFTVPHRDEYSETVGFRVSGPGKSLVWLPDIDSWMQWDRSLEEVVREVDYAFIDGTFWDRSELSRDIGEIPHPLVSETMEQLSHLHAAERSKVHFIHLNHTNPLLNIERSEYAATLAAGFRVGTRGQRIELS